MRIHYSYPFEVIVNCEVDWFLRIRINGEYYPVQTSHMELEQLLHVLSGTSWWYEGITGEGISLFNYSIARSKCFPEDLFDVKPVSDPSLGYWITPKGFPREYLE